MELSADIQKALSRASAKRDMRERLVRVKREDRQNILVELLSELDEMPDPPPAKAAVVRLVEDESDDDGGDVSTPEDQSASDRAVEFLTANADGVSTAEMAAHLYPNQEAGKARNIRARNVMYWLRTSERAEFTDSKWFLLESTEDDTKDGQLPIRILRALEQLGSGQRSGKIVEAVNADGYPEATAAYVYTTLGRMTKRGQLRKVKQRTGRAKYYLPKGGS